MPIKELIIGAAPRSTVADYIKDIDNWEDARLAVAESHMDSYDVPDLLTWGSEFISVKNLKLWKMIVRLRPKKVTILFNLFMSDANIVNALQTIRKVTRINFQISVPDKTILLREISDRPSLYLSNPGDSVPTRMGLRAIDLMHSSARLLSKGLESAFVPSRGAEDPGKIVRYTATTDKWTTLQTDIEMPALSRKLTAKEVYIKGLKATSYTPEKYQGKPKVVLLGASHLKGALLENEKTLGWKLQERFPDHQIVIHALGGITAGQQFFLLQKLLREDTSIQAVVSYITAGMEAKVLARPFPRLMPKFQITAQSQPILPTQGKPLWQYLCPRERRSETAIVCDAISLMHADCAQRGIDFLVASEMYSQNLYPFLTSHGIPWVPCSIGPKGEIMEQHIDEWTFWPMDPHPNEKAHDWFATVIGDALNAQMQGNPLPTYEHLLGEEYVNRPAATHNQADDVYPLF